MGVSVCHIATPNFGQTLIEAVWNKCQWGAHYVGRGGVLSFAVSAVDIALWDLRCKKAGEPLWKLLGGGSGDGEARCYAGGIDLQGPDSIEKIISSQN